MDRAGMARPRSTARRLHRRAAAERGGGGRGGRSLWPIYAAAERHGLPIGIHAGSAYRHPVTSLGWPSYYIEDYAAQSQAFQSQVTSLICEGVLTKHPGL